MIPSYWSTFLRRFAAFVALVAVATLPATAQPKPFIINVVLSMTGLAANLGHDQASAFAALEQYVNASGGIRGTPVHFQIADDQSQPAVAVQLLQQILQQHPAVVLGSSLAGPTQAMAALVEAQGPILYALTPNLYPKARGWVFSTSATTRDLTAVAFAYYRARGVTKFATLVNNDASGQNNMEAVNLALTYPENKSLQIVDQEVIALSDVSGAAQAAKIKASGAQVVFALSSGTAFGTALHGLSDVGLDLPVFTSAANFSPQFLDSLKGVLPKDLLASGASFFNRDRAASDPLKKPIDDFYAALAGQGVRVPVATHAFAWDPGLLVVTAFRQLGTGASAQQVHDWIENQKHYPGVQGFFDFSAGDQHGLGLSGLLMLRSDPASPGRSIVVSKGGGAPL
jgi:branched-chain amino acid transport system substrate-binding protein